MSFLSELKKQKSKLKEIETVVTNADGQRYIEKGTDKTPISPNAYGFVVDNKPDNVPVLVVEHLLIGSQDCAVTEVLTTHNITNVLSVGVDAGIKNVRNKFVQCLDLPETDMRPTLADCLPFIHEAIGRKENVLVHCNAGVSRTAAVAIAYLMHYHAMPFEVAHALVKNKRPAIQPNAGFTKQLKNMKPGEII